MSTITTKERIKGKDQGNLEISINENPILRFAPEPSGYLHLGHTKAFFLNLHFSKEIMRIRFDDTNPLKETLEFENALKEDLSLIADKKLHFSRSSDYFYTLLFYVHKFIQQNYAYVDNTPVDLMREERDKGIESKNRNNSVEKNLEIFGKMLEKENKDFCVRAKIDMKSKNKSVRDPVIFRFNFAEHYVYKDSFFLYPTYDFACPIIDSIEGVTDVFRSNEYRDRNEQYNWFIDKLRGINYSLEEILPYLKKIKEIFGKNLTKKVESDFLFFKKYCKSLFTKENDFSFTNPKEKEIINLKEFNSFLISCNFEDEINFDYFLIFNYFTCKTFPGIIDFSRLSFENTILSKRNLKEIIFNNKLTWDDPRIPTLRGILRKGLKIDALKEYILMQGVAQKTSIFSWDKLWSINKKVIDELSGRYFCIEEENLVELEICSEYNFGVQKVPIHRKNIGLGTKNLLFSQVIYLDKRDLELIKDSEFTLMYFSAAKIKDNKIFLTDSDPRKIKHKIHWVSKLNSVKVKLIYFDDLLKEDVFNDQSKKEVWCVGEQSLMNVKEGDVVQLERIGFFYCDSEGIYHSVPYTAQVRKY